MELMNSSTPKLSEFDQKVLTVCRYLVNHRSTCRLTAYKFDISQTTVRNYVQKHLERLDPELYEEATRLIKLNQLDSGTPKGNRV